MFMEVCLTYLGPSRQLSGVDLNLVLYESEGQPIGHIEQGQTQL